MSQAVTEHGETLVVALDGEVDLSRAPEVRALLLDCVGRGRDVLVDLSRVSYIDSSGIASLVEAFQEARKRGSRFALAAVSPAALRVFELARLDRVFVIHATLEEALGNDA